MKSLKIGKITLKNRLFLAPMVDVTDVAYRMVCRKAGAGMAYTEMLYVDAITHPNHKTQQLMKIAPRGDHPIGIQITGNNLTEFKKVIPFLKPYDLVDINCGCPSVRIVGSEAGSYLLKDPKKITSFVQLLKEAGLTVTVKIRLGFDKNEVLELAKIIEDAGADAVTVHARLATHSNKTPADWQWIAAVKKQARVPVIGNGDILTGKDAEKMLQIADGAMVARGAMGDPYIFERMLQYLKTGTEPAFDVQKNLESFQSYVLLCEKYDVVDLHRIKNTGSNFIRGFPGAGKYRAQLMETKTLIALKEFSRSLIQDAYRKEKSESTEKG